MQFLESNMTEFDFRDFKVKHSSYNLDN